MTALVQEEEWLIDGFSLNTWAYNIESLSGRNGLPVMEGSNSKPLYTHGEVWRPKFAAAKTLTLGMWVRGINPDGTIPSTPSARRAQYNDNLRNIKKALFKPDRQVWVQRKVRHSDGIKILGQWAEVVGAMEPTMAGKNVGRMVVDLKMPKPFWEGSLVNGPSLTPATTVTGFTINNPGDVPCRIYFNFLGPLTTFTLRNDSGNPAAYIFNYTTGISAGHYFEFDSGTYFAQASEYVNPGSYSFITHTGHTSWMELLPGLNYMTFYQTSVLGGYFYYRFIPLYL